MPRLLTSAVLLAAGSSTRFGPGTLKQFADLCGTPVYKHAECALRDSGLFEETIVATKEHLGGPTRLETAYNPILTVRTPWVVVHDAARPFVPKPVLERLLGALEAGADAAGTCLPQVDTVIQADGDKMAGTIDRQSCVLSQTPQAFRTETLRNALEDAVCNHYDTSEFLELVRQRGGDVRLVEGSPWLFKITHRPDIYAAKGWLIEQGKRRAIVTGGSSGIGEAVKYGLREHGYHVADFSRTTGVDVSIPEQVASAFRDFRATYGSLDCVVLCAGTASSFLLNGLSNARIEETERMVATNLLGTYHSLAMAVSTLSPGGIIVLVGSSGIEGRKKQGMYGATKAAAAHLALVAAQERDDVTVLTVCPRRTATPLRRELTGLGNEPGLLDPADVGRFIVSLCLEPQIAQTGQTFYYPALRGEQ